MGLHIELNSWTQAEEHFRDVDQDQGREHVDRDMFNCEPARLPAFVRASQHCWDHRG